VTLLFTAPGVPCIYYGDEIGLEGGPDPDCRRCFDWDRSHWNRPLFEHYRQLARLRRERAEWRSGAWQTLALGPDWLAYARYNAEAATVVAVNRGVAVSVSLPMDRLPLDGEKLANWVEADGQPFRVERSALSFELPERGALVLMSC
jgi:alpha-glucosidase